MAGAVIASTGLDAPNHPDAKWMGLSVPFTVIAAMGASFDRTQNYTMALNGVAVVLLAVIPLALYAAGRKLSPA